METTACARRAGALKSYRVCALSSGHVTFCILWVFPYYILLCFCILRCALGVRSIFRWSGLLVFLYLAVRTSCAQQFPLDASGTDGVFVLLYYAVCARCAHHFPYVATLTQMEPNGLFVLRNSTVCAKCAQHFP